MIHAMLEQRIQQQFFDSADLKYAAAEILAKPISDAVSAVVGCITGGGKVLACGNGGSASDAQHFAAEFIGRFRAFANINATNAADQTPLLVAEGHLICCTTFVNHPETAAFIRKPFKKRKNSFRSWKK